MNQHGEQDLFDTIQRGIKCNDSSVFADDCQSFPSTSQARQTRIQSGSPTGHSEIGDFTVRTKPGFCITGMKGFHITFENGYTVSVQFGPGNYCDNYDRSIGQDEKKSGSDGSTTAECAVCGPNGSMIEYKDWGGTVSNRSTPAEVLELLNWASVQPGQP